MLRVTTRRGIQATVEPSVFIAPLIRSNPPTVNGSSPESTTQWATQSSVDYLPAIAGARGFGMETTHCLGSRSNPSATVLTVDRLTSSSTDGAGTRGSLAWCLTRNFPRYIEFAVSGTIQLNGQINIDNGSFYLAGETAPSPGIFLRQGLLNIRCSDGVISHINSYMGGGSGSPSTESRDALSVALGAQRIVIANCSAFWGVDETMQAYNANSDITFWQCLLAEPLDRSSLKLAQGAVHHGFGLLMAGAQTSPTRISMLRNALCFCVNRNPLTRALLCMIADNIVYNWGRASSSPTAGGCMVLTSDNGNSTDNNIESNLWLHGPDNGGNQAPILANSAAESLAQGSRLFQARNRLVGQTGVIVNNAAGVTNLLQVARISGAWASGYVPTLDSTWSNDDYVNLHKRYVGACPAYSTGRRALQFDRMLNYLSGSGSMGSVVDGVEASDTEAGGTVVSGGWGNIPTAGQVQNTIDHASAGAHGGDPRPTGININEIMPSGYTRLEEWTHRRYAELML